MKRIMNDDEYCICENPIIIPKSRIFIGGPYICDICGYEVNQDET